MVDRNICHEIASVPLTVPSPLCADTPSQRVQFILGTEDDDEEHIPHDLFTELDELSFRDGHAYEWKETARCVCVLCMCVLCVCVCVCVCVCLFVCEGESKRE